MNLSYTFDYRIDQNKARNIARQIFYKYDRDRTNVLDLGKASMMLSDGTRHISSVPIPTKQDIALFMKYLDANKDGRSSAIKYLCSNYAVKASKITYTSVVRKRLEVARRLFNQFDKDGSNTLTENQIPAIIRETYNEMGIEYQPTSEDVKSWMAMTDFNQFEAMIIRSLQHIGIKIYQ